MIVIKGADFLSWGNQKCVVQTPLSLILIFIMVYGKGSNNKIKKIENFCLHLAKNITFISLYTNFIIQKRTESIFATNLFQMIFVVSLNFDYYSIIAKIH